MARVAVRIVTAFGAEELISGTAGYLPQWAGKDLRHTDASFAGFAALAVRIDAAFRADQLTGDTTGHPISTDDGVGLACAVATVVAVVTIRVVAALRADQLIIDAASDQTPWQRMMSGSQRPSMQVAHSPQSLVSQHSSPSTHSMVVSVGGPETQQC